MSPSLALVISISSVVVVAIIVYIATIIILNREAKHKVAQEIKRENELTTLFEQNRYPTPVGQLTGTGSDGNDAKAFEKIADKIKTVKYIEGY